MWGGARCWHLSKIKPAAQSEPWGASNFPIRGRARGLGAGLSSGTCGGACRGGEQRRQSRCWAGVAPELPRPAPWGCWGASCACNRRLEARPRQAAGTTCRTPHGCWWLGSRHHGSPAVLPTCLRPWEERGCPAGRCRAAGQRAL